MMMKKTTIFCAAIIIKNAQGKTLKRVKFIARKFDLVFKQKSGNFRSRLTRTVRQKLFSLQVLQYLKYLKIS